MEDNDETTRVTDYVLGELSADEKTVFDLKYQSDRGLQADVDEVRGLSSFIFEDLRPEPAWMLTTRQREQVMELVQPRETPASAPIAAMVAAPHAATLAERFELFVLFGVFVALAPIFPRLLWFFHGTKQAARSRMENPDLALESHLDFGPAPEFSIDALSPDQIRVALLAATLAVMGFAFVRIRGYSRERMPGSWYLLSVLLYLLFQFVLNRLLRPT